MKPCPDVAWLRQLLDEKIADEDKRWFKQHSSSCARCQDAMENLIKTTRGAAPVTSITTSGNQETPKPSSTAVKKPARPVPQKIGRFEVRALLGEGAFGSVYRAHDPKLDRDIALKVPKTGVLVTERDRKLFFREAQSAAGLRHPNICSVHEVHDDTDPPYIVMDFIAGKSLADYLHDRSEPLPMRQSAIIVHKLALALEVAHKKKIVHRDLKPANIMIDLERKDVVIMDFGLAHRILAEDAETSQQGAIIGTPAYMSPEQARGDTRAVSPASDIFCLGVILYELLTGTRPFHGSLHDVLGKIQRSEAKPPSKVRGSIDPRLEAICLKALAKKPEERFRSMKEMAQAIQRYLKDAPVTPKTKDPATKGELAPFADVLAALSAENKTVVAAQRSLAKVTVAGLGCVGVSVCFTGVALAVAIWLFTRVGPDGESKGGDLISVKLSNVTYINDNSVHYYLDGKKIDSAKLKDFINVSAGEHELIAKRGDEVLETRRFRVGSADAAKDITAFVVEPEREVGPVWTDKFPTTARSVAVTPDGSWFLVSGFRNEKDGLVAMWDVVNGTKKHSLPMRHAGLIASAPYANLVFCEVAPSGLYREGLVVQYDITDSARWKDLKRFDTTKLYHYTTSFEVSADGKRFLKGGGLHQSKGYAPSEQAKVTVWSITDGTQVAQFTGGHVGCFAKTPDHVFVSRPGEKELALFDISGKEPVEVRWFTGHTSVISCAAVSDDGKFIAAGTRQPTNSARIWDVANGKQLQFFQGHGDEVTSIVFSHDGERLATSSSDGTVRLWDAKTGQQLYTTPDQRSPVLSACLTPGGRCVAFGCANGTIKLWQLPR